jgi:hypothetical protein
MKVGYSIFDNADIAEGKIFRSHAEVFERRTAHIEMGAKLETIDLGNLSSVDGNFQLFGGAFLTSVDLYPVH